MTEECLSVYNIDGSIRKTQKSKLLEMFLLRPVLEVPREYVSLIDMGYIWRFATPRPEDKERLYRDGLDYTWWDYKVASLIFACHQNASNVFCVNDIYDQIYNIEDDEHERRAAKEQNIPNLYMKSDDKFPTASRFKQLLNSKNEVRIQNLIENKLLLALRNYYFRKSYWKT